MSTESPKTQFFWSGNALPDPPWYDQYTDDDDDDDDDEEDDDGISFISCRAHSVSVASNCFLNLILSVCPFAYIQIWEGNFPNDYLPTIRFWESFFPHGNVVLFWSYHASAKEIEWISQPKIYL